jgi:L-Ala-D/L-Glu epimerase
LPVELAVAVRGALGSVGPVSSSPTLIARLNVTRLDIPLHVPFGISGGAQPAANNVLVSVDLADGTRGLGEGAPLPPYNGETQAATFQALTLAHEWVVGTDARSWRETGAMFRARVEPPCGAAICALETAMLDALCRHDGIPLWKFFGGAGTELETDMTITLGTPEEARAAAAAIRAQRIHVIKIKIGAEGGPEEDLARIQAAHAVAPDAPLILDGNAGLTRSDADELVEQLQAEGITPALLEQWLPQDDLEGMRELGAKSGWLVAADESVSNADEANQIADAGAAQVINIKLMKAGIATALEVVEVARRRDLQLMIGGNVESILAMTTSACFAAGLGGFRYADLDTPWFLAANPFTGGFVAEGGRLSLASIRRGHGVELA